MYQQSTHNDVTKWKQDSDFGKLTDIDQMPKKDLWHYLERDSNGTPKSAFQESDNRVKLMMKDVNSPTREKLTKLKHPDNVNIVEEFAGINIKDKNNILMCTFGSTAFGAKIPGDDCPDYPKKFAAWQVVNQLGIPNSKMIEDKHVKYTFDVTSKKPFLLSSVSYINEYDTEPVGIDGKHLGKIVDDKVKLFNDLQKDKNNKVNLMSSFGFFVSINDKLEKIGTDGYMIDILYGLVNSVNTYNRIKQVNWNFITIVNNMLNRYDVDPKTVYVGQEIDIIEGIVRFKERLTLLLGMQNLPLVTRNYVDLTYINKEYLFRPCYNESKLEKCYVDKTNAIVQKNWEYADIIDQYKKGQKPIDYKDKYNVVNSFDHIYFPFTGLGYTYDIGGMKTKNTVGFNEFVIFPFTPVVHKKVLTMEEYIGLLLDLPYIQNQIKILNKSNYVGGGVKYGGRSIKLKKIQ